MTTRVEMFVDYVCPYCFLAEGAVQELARERDVEIEIRPFELRPYPVPTLKPEDDYLPRVWNGSVYPMARQLGVPITLPSVSPQPRTEKAFMALQLAKERDLAGEYSRAMYTAFFREDRDIGEDDVIVDVAAAVGLDRAETERALIDPERRTRRAAEQADALQAGVGAVPSFRIEGLLLSGVADAARLKAAVDQVARPGATR